MNRLEASKVFARLFRPTLVEAPVGYADFAGKDTDPRALIEAAVARGWLPETWHEDTFRTFASDVVAVPYAPLPESDPVLATPNEPAPNPRNELIFAGLSGVGSGLASLFLGPKPPPQRARRSGASSRSSAPAPAQDGFMRFTTGFLGGVMAYARNSPAIQRAAENAFREARARTARERELAVEKALVLEPTEAGAPTLEQARNVILFGPRFFDAERLAREFATRMLGESGSKAVVWRMADPDTVRKLPWFGLGADGKLHVTLGEAAGMLVPLPELPPDPVALPGRQESVCDVARRIQWKAADYGPNDPGPDVAGPLWDIWSLGFAVQSLDRERIVLVAPYATREQRAQETTP